MGVFCRPDRFSQPPRQSQGVTSGIEAVHALRSGASVRYDNTGGGVPNSTPVQPDLSEKRVDAGDSSQP
jgi:hypothetical protein